MTAFPVMPIFSPNFTLTDVVLSATATSTASTIVAPADIRSGDLLVLIDAPTYPGSGSSGSSPAGFTTLASTAFGGWFNGVQKSAKIANGTEGGTTITGMNGTTSNSKVLFVFRGNSSVASFTVLNPAESATNGNPGTLSVSNSGPIGPAILVCTASTYSAATVSFEAPFTTPAFDVVNNSVSRLCVGLTTLGYNEAFTGSQAIDMTDYGSGNILTGLWLQLA